MTAPHPSPAPDERELFALAAHALLAVVRQVREDQWDLPTAGEVTPAGPPSHATLRQDLAYHAYEDAWVAPMLAGRTMAQEGEDAHSGDLLGADPAGASAHWAERAVTAVRAHEALDSTVHCSFGDYPARDYLWQAVYFRATRAVEFARLLGVDDTLPDELVAPMLPYFREHAQEWREFGVLGPAVEVPAGATPQEELLALLGRRPR